MQALPRVRYKGEDYFFDERLSELRDVYRPWKSIPLKDYEIWWIKHVRQCPNELSFG